MWKCLILISFVSLVGTAAEESSELSSLAKSRGDEYRRKAVALADSVFARLDETQMAALGWKERLTVYMLQARSRYGKQFDAWLQNPVAHTASGSVSTSVLDRSGDEETEEDEGDARREYVLEELLFGTRDEEWRWPHLQRLIEVGVPGEGAMWAAVLKGTDEEWLRRLAANGVGMWNNARAEELCVGVLSDPKEKSAVRTALVKGLHQNMAPWRGEVLLRCLEAVLNESELSAHVLYLMAIDGSAKCREGLRTLAQDTGRAPQMRMSALSCMKIKSDDADRRVFIEIAKSDKNAEVRGWALSGFRQFGIAGDIQDALEWIMRSEKEADVVREGLWVIDANGKAKDTRLIDTLLQREEWVAAAGLKDTCDLIKKNLGKRSK